MLQIYETVAFLKINTALIVFNLIIDYSQF